MNNRPFSDQTTFDHLNNGLVWYADPHCIILLSLPQCFVRNLDSDDELTYLSLIQSGSEIRTSLDFKWSKKRLQMVWILKSGQMVWILNGQVFE